MRSVSPALLLLVLGALLPAQGTDRRSTALPNARMCYDQSRQRLVFGLPSQDIWEWDGADWGRMRATLPAAPTACLYDDVRQRVMFVCGGHLQAYDGHGFVDHGVLPASGTNLAVDSGRGRLVLFSSGANSTIRIDEWDGSTWQQAPAPAASLLPASAAYDVARGVMVLQALSLPNAATFETWESNGTTWVQRSAANQTGGPIVFDPATGQVIRPASPVQAWNGVTWTSLANATAGLAGDYAADPGRGLVWSHSGSPGHSNSIWAWDGQDWSRRFDAPQTSVGGGVLTFDPARGRAVLFGGITATDHREWDGTRWRNMLTGYAGPVPPARELHAQVYDSVRQETVVFGGFGGAITRGDTWAFDGRAWRLVATSGPSARQQPAVAFDSVRGRVVLVGGTVFSTVLGDHWEWDGTQWLQVASSTPMGAVLGALGYDPARSRSVFADSQGRTWEYNGAIWSQVAIGSPVPHNPTRRMHWNAARQRLQCNMTSVPQRYEWDGSQWSLVGNYLGDFVFDPARGVTIGYRPESLTIESSSLAVTSDFGAACGGSTTDTSLTTFGVPRPGDAAFHLDVRATATMRPAMIGFGLGATSVPLGNGCTLLLQNPFASLVWFTNQNGFWHQPLPLPADLALRGITLVAQAAVLDPASPGNFAMSQGLTLTVGD